MSENKSKYTFSVKEQFSIAFGILGYAKPFWYLFAAAVTLSFALNALNAYLPLVVTRYIDDVLVPGTFTTQTFIGFVIIYGGLTVLSLIGTFIKQLLFTISSEKTVAHLRNTAYEKVSSLGMRFFDQTPLGTIVSRVTNDTESIKEFYAVLLTLIESIFSIIAVLFAMYTLNGQIATYFLFFTPIMAVLIYCYQRFSSEVYTNMRVYLSTINAKLNESIVGMAIIQHFRQEQRMNEEFNVINRKHFQERKNIFAIDSVLLRPAMNFLEGLALTLIVYVFGRLSFETAIDVGMVYAFSNYTKSFFQPMGQMMDSLSTLQDGLVSGTRIFSLMTNKEMSPKQTPIKDLDINNASIEFKNVSFSYDGENKVLNDISFKVADGETIAFVGQTGSGKSSIINVLMRFYEFQEGDVLIDGQSIRNYPIQEIRDNFGLVLQDSFLFFGDINSNIRMNDTSISDADIIETAKFVQANDFIDRLDKSYESTVIERGAAFSSGEKQLLSFARTMVRNPKVLILDEATANIDTETEEKIQSSLKKMQADRTTISIAHRLSTIKDANQIIVLDKGHIIEQGTHQELINQKGQYFRMYQLQALGTDYE